MKDRHVRRLLANFVTVPQWWFRVFISYSTIQRQVFVGLPINLRDVVWGFSNDVHNPLPVLLHDGFHTFLFTSFKQSFIGDKFLPRTYTEFF